MGYRTKVQLIKRKKSEQWYINVPSALAQAIDLTKGEIVEWTFHNRNVLVLKRPQAPDSPLKNGISIPLPEGSKSPRAH